MATLQGDEVAHIIALGTFGILLLVGGIALFMVLYQRRLLAEQRKQQVRESSYQQQMIQLQLESQEKERIRIAADLHDSLGSLLWGAKVNAAFIQRSQPLHGEVKDSHAELVQILDQCIGTVRRIAWELTPEAFHHAGLSQSVAKLCEQLHGKVVQVVVNEEGHREWNDVEALQVFRIIQELISNVVKHAQASLLTVTMRWEVTQLSVEVMDNGVGFALNEIRQGVGWWNIQQRAKKLDIQLQIGIPPSGKGTCVLLTIPLKHEV